MDARMVARIPRKFAHAGRAAGWRRAKAAEMIKVASACKRQIAVTAMAVLYVAPFRVVDKETSGSVGEVTRGK